MIFLWLMIVRFSSINTAQACNRGKYPRMVVCIWSQLRNRRHAEDVSGCLWRSIRRTSSIPTGVQQTSAPAHGSFTFEPVYWLPACCRQKDLLVTVHRSSQLRNYRRGTGSYWGEPNRRNATSRWLRLYHSASKWTGLKPTPPRSGDAYVCSSLVVIELAREINHHNQLITPPAHL